MNSLTVGVCCKCNFALVVFFVLYFFVNFFYKIISTWMNENSPSEFYEFKQTSTFLKDMSTSTCYSGLTSLLSIIN